MTAGVKQNNLKKILKKKDIQEVFKLILNGGTKMHIKILSTDNKNSTKFNCDLKIFYILYGYHSGQHQVIRWVIFLIHCHGDSIERFLKNPIEIIICYA